MTATPRRDSFTEGLDILTDLGRPTDEAVRAYEKHTRRLKEVTRAFGLGIGLALRAAKRDQAKPDLKTYEGPLRRAHAAWKADAALKEDGA